MTKKKRTPFIVNDPMSVVSWITENYYSGTNKSNDVVRSLRSYSKGEKYVIEIDCNDEVYAEVKMVWSEGDVD
jgi:hypothetical protein